LKDEGLPVAEAFHGADEGESDDETEEAEDGTLDLGEAKRILAQALDESEAPVAALYRETDQDRNRGDEKEEVAQNGTMKADRKC
jgi:hypothetical protein